MSLIPFPYVAELPGVPDLPRNPIALAAAALALASTLAPIQLDEPTIQALDLSQRDLGAWSILNDQGAQVIKPDSVLSVEYKIDTRVSSYPVEQGGFASYNKVQMPYELRIVMVCNGQGDTMRDDFLATMEDMRDSLDLYSIVTPDATYLDANLVAFDYRRDSRSGMSMITVDAIFVEIRTTAQSSRQNTADPSGRDPQNQGAVSATSPTASQSAAFNGVQ